jgi:hypothetical protein
MNIRDDAPYIGGLAPVDDDFGIIGGKRFSNRSADAFGGTGDEGAQS